MEAGAAKKVAEVLSENGIDGDGGDGEGGEESGSLILRREVAAGGKGRIFVNNQPATVAVLKRLGRIWLRFMRRTRPCWRLMRGRGYHSRCVCWE